MRKKRLKETIKERRVYNVFKEIDYHLQLMSLNAADNHQKESVRCGFVYRMSKYEDKICPVDETFEEFRKRDRPDYESSIRLIEDSIKRFQIAV